MDRREFLVETIAGMVGFAGLGDIASAAEVNESLHGLIARADVVNSNGRLYPREVLEKAVQEFNRNHKHSMSMLGQLGMPETAKIQFSKASHLVKNLRMQGDYLVGDFKIINTPAGNQLLEMMKKPDSVAFRTQGMGTVKVNDDGVAVIQDDFKLITVNAVSMETAAKI